MGWGFRTLPLGGNNMDSIYTLVFSDGISKDRVFAVYETLAKAIESVEVIGPRQFGNGWIHVIKEDFPGPIGVYGTTIVTWEYQTNLGCFAL